MRCTLSAFALALAMAGAVAELRADEPAAKPAGEQWPSRETPATRVYRLRRNAVVSLRSSTLTNIPARVETNELGHPKQQLGTGLLIDPRGYVVTCFHVVKDMGRHEAQDASGVKHRVRIVNYDERQDLALLKLEGGPGKRFDYVPLWGNEAIVGENAFSIGNPYGLADSLTIGHVGAIHRSMRMHHQESFADLVQMDSGINPGNSGGPVFDVRGQLLGITVAIRREAQCLAFAIPTRVVSEVVNNLMGGPAPSDRLGMKVRDVVRPEGPLLEVAGVEANSAAARMGLEKGDTIRTADGEPIASAFDLHRQYWERGPDTALKLTIGRGKQAREVTLTPATPTRPSQDDLAWERLGLWVAPVAPERVQWINSRLEGGLLVRAVAPGKWGAATGLQVGDIVYGVVPPGSEGYNMKSVDDLCWCLRSEKFPAGMPASARFARDGATMPDAAAVFPKLHPGE